MVSHNVKHFEDMRLCVPGCHPAAVAVLRSECAGAEAVQLLQLIPTAAEHDLQSCGYCSRRRTHLVGCICAINDSVKELLGLKVPKFSRRKLPS